MRSTTSAGVPLRPRVPLFGQRFSRATADRLYQFIVVQRLIDASQVLWPQLIAVRQHHPKQAALFTSSSNHILSQVHHRSTILYQRIASPGMPNDWRSITHRTFAPGSN